MLKIQNLTITYRRDGRVLADHFDLVLNSLDKAVLIGEEGNGKSTLLKWIHDPALIEDYADAEGICLKEKEKTGWLQIAGLAVLFAYDIVLLVSNTYNPFIYFRF